VSLHRVTCLLVLLAGIVLVPWVVEATPVIRAAADDFMPARLYHDLFVAGGAWGDWHLPAAPYYFPDLALYFLLLASGVPFASVATAYALVIGAATGLCAWWIGARLYGDRVVATIAALALLAGLIVAGEEHTFWNRPIFHYGVFLNALLVLGLLLVSTTRRWMLFPLFLVIVAAVMSDFLFVPVVTASVGGVLAAMWLTGALRFRDCLVAGVIAAAAVVAGAGLHFAATPNAPVNPLWASGMQLRHGVFHPLSHWVGLRYALAELWSPLFATVGVLGLGAGIVLRRSRAEQTDFLIVTAFFVCGILANLYVAGLDTYPSARDRYAIFATNGGIAYVCFCIGYLALEAAWLRQVIPLAIAVTAALVLAADEEDRPGERVARMLDTRDCLVRVADRVGLKYGLASYSDANRYTVLTNHRIELTQVRGNSLSYLPWQRSDRWLRRPVSFVVAEDSVRPGVYDSKRLAYPLSEDIVTAEAGAPMERHQCNDLVVMVYPPEALQATLR